MSLRALDMPDEPARLAAWLETQLTGPDLAGLADELSAFRGPPAGPAPDVGELLGEWRGPVLAGGLRLAPPEVARRLLAWPERLADLQELVFAEGGRYWDRFPAPADDVQRGRARLATALGSSNPEEATEPRPAVLPLRKEPARRRYGWAIGAAAVAAAALITLFVARSFPPHGAMPPQVAWGWNKPGLLSSGGSAADYLNRLADAADEWFAERPDDPATLARRLNELRAGCTALQFAEHRPLSREDRDWLSDKCRQWAARIDQDLAEAEAGQGQAARAEADDTVRRIVAALRERAAEKTAALRLFQKTMI